MAVTDEYNNIVTPQGARTACVTVLAAEAAGTYGDLTNTQVLIDTSTCPDGALVKRIYALPLDTCSQNQARLYRVLNPTATTPTPLLADTVYIPNISVSTQTAIQKTYFGDQDGTGTKTPYSDANPFRIGPGETLRVGLAYATIPAKGIQFCAEYEAY